ncbi:MAG: GumC family protein [Planctomycetota bacterium]|jgi:uncharacterized protein involved in exopolysaccharide biosynthesis
MVARRQREAPLGSLRDFWSLLMRRKLTAAIMFVVVTATVVFGSFTIPPTYTAQTTIMVKHGREFYYQAAAGDANEGSPFSLQEMVNSEVEILRSRDLAEHVVGKLGPERLYPDLLENPEADPETVFAAAAFRFRDSIVVMDVLESSIIRISFDHGDPRLAADALNLLVEKFKEKHVEIFSDPKTAFISDQLAAYEAKLAESEDALEAFRQTHGVYSLLEQKSLLLNQRVTLDTELDTTAFRIAELEQRLTFLNGKLTSDEPSEPPPPATEDRASLVARRGKLSSALQEAQMRLAELQQQLVVLRDRARSTSDAVAPLPGVQNFRSLDEAFIRLLDLQLREKELLHNYNEQSRQVLAVRNEIEMVEEFLRKRGAFLESVVEITLRDELEGLIARRATALEQVEQVDAAIRAYDVRQTLDELAPLQARRARIRQELGQLDEEIMTLDRHENDLRQLERRAVLDERNYQAFVDKSEAGRIMEELDRQKMINIAVIEEASPPVYPSSLSRNLRIMLGVFVGLIAGVAAAVFLELVRA